MNRWEDECRVCCGPKDNVFSINCVFKDNTYNSDSEDKKINKYPPPPAVPPRTPGGRGHLVEDLCQTTF